MQLFQWIRLGEQPQCAGLRFDKPRVINYVDIERRVYRGEVGAPKAFRSKGWAAFGGILKCWIQEWLQLTPDTGPDGWLFPSEKPKTPLSRDNRWRRDFLPKLRHVGLGWATFKVMRRTHSCLMDELQVDPQVPADQMGRGGSNRSRRAAADPISRQWKSAGVETGQRSGASRKHSSQCGCSGLCNLYDPKEIGDLDISGAEASQPSNFRL